MSSMNVSFDGFILNCIDLTNDVLTEWEIKNVRLRLRITVRNDGVII